MSNGDETAIDSFTTEKVNQLKIKKKGKGRKLFEKGNKLGKKFGAGQPTNLGGGRKSATTIFQEMKTGWENMGFAATDIANAIVKLGLDETIEPRFRFPFLKEAALRIYGPVDSAIDEALLKLRERQSSSGEKPFELSLPLLEATAVSDSVGLVRELVKQGRLGEVLRQIEGEQDEQSEASRGDE